MASRIGPALAGDAEGADSNLIILDASDVLNDALVVTFSRALMA
ncbi:MAG: hypothetical protein ABWY64_08995 [Tardiphaga sp.]|jgi:hypothetical protein